MRQLCVKTEKSKKGFNNLSKNYQLYLLMIPGLLFLIVFKYVPMGGILIAFQDFNIFEGIMDSRWVGFENFRRLFQYEEFYQVFKNTLLISVYKLAFLFPLSIFVALVINEIKHLTFKKVVQTVIYLPHFLSWVVVAGVFINLLSPNGIVNDVIKAFGREPVSFMMNTAFFRSVLVAAAGWKETGWSAIIFIVAITSIDPQLYEAAVIDGAGRVRQMLHITLPSILSTIVLIFIMKLGAILDAGTEQILVMYNAAVYEVADVIGTYVYRMGIGKMDYSFSTAVGLFNSVVGLILVLSGNALSRKLVGKSIW